MGGEERCHMKENQIYLTLGSVTLHISDYYVFKELRAVCTTGNIFLLITKLKTEERKKSQKLGYMSLIFLTPLFSFFWTSF